MKQDCLIVQDLYPLYIDNELHTEVLSWVGSHLKACPRCRKGYQEGKGFQELLPLTKAAPSETIDIRLTRWVRSFRIRIVTLVTLIALIIALIAYNQAYAQNREVLRWAIRSYERNLLIVENYFRYQSPDKTFRFESTKLLGDSGTLIGLNLTSLERSRNELVQLGFVGDENLFASLTLLHYRAKYGYWSDLDQNYANTVGDCFKELREAALRLRPGSNLLDRFFAPLSLEELTILTQRIMHAGDTYWLTNSLPGTLAPLPDHQLTQMVENLFPNTTIEDISYITGSASRSYSLLFENHHDATWVILSVWQNIYTGQIYRVMGSQLAGYFPGENEAQEVLEFLKINFGPAEYRLKASGDGNYQVSLAEPLPADTGIIITWNSHLKAPVSLESPFGSNVAANNLGDLNYQTLTPAEALEQYANPEGYEFTRTLVIHSAMTGQLELVYEYRYAPRDYISPLLLNVKTGRRDFSYSTVFTTF